MVAFHLCDSGAIGKGNSFDSELKDAGKYSKFKIERAMMNIIDLSFLCRFCYYRNKRAFTLIQKS